MPADSFGNVISSGSYIVVALKEGWGVKLPIYKVLKLNPKSLRVATLKHNWKTGGNRVVESNLSAYDLSAVVPASYAPEELRNYKEESKRSAIGDWFDLQRHVNSKVEELWEKHVSTNN